MNSKTLQYGRREARVDANWRRRFRRRLTGWYGRQARDLPWRRRRDPYSVWVSEVMLQQTTVAAVIPFYERFMRAFPTLHALAAASLEDVLRAWEGLGYYQRARNLHRAAQIIVQRHGGQVPSDADSLRALPGIGRYMAGAILSIAFEQREPILEANSLRVLSRVLAVEGDPRRGVLHERLWAAARQLLPRRRVGRFNQAMMELGSKVCRVRRPLCASCPIVGLCVAYKRGVQERIPVRPTRKPAREIREVAMVVRRRGRVLLVRRPERGRWAGLYDFPRWDISSSDGNADSGLSAELSQNIRRLTGLSVAMGKKLGEVRYSVMNERVRLKCYEAQPRRASNRSRRATSLLWASRDQLQRLPMSVPARRICQLLARRSDR